MNYYDEEISINGPDTKNLSTIKVDRMPLTSSSGGGVGGNPARQVSGGSQGPSGSSHLNRRQRIMTHGNSTDDDGLLQDILDHDDDDDDDDDDDEDDDDIVEPQKKATPPRSGSAARRNASQPRPTSTRILTMPAATTKLDNDSEASETESDDDDDDDDDDVAGAGGGLIRGQGMPLRMSSVGGASAIGIGSAAKGRTQTHDTAMGITTDQWEQLPVPKDVKDLFPFILKYTPQNIEIPYHLQPFVPEYVPAVGDVDAFLKVIVPPLGELDSINNNNNSTTDPAAQQQQKEQRQKELDDHLSKLGLYFLDEPSGEQSEPSLLNMKLRSVLSGSTGGRRGGSSLSATMVPIAKTPRDMDKWINEIEQVHMTQAIYDAQPRKDIEALLIEWPRTYATKASAAAQDAYQRCLRDDMSLTEYINVLCREFEIDGGSETQADYILNVHTLFSLYLAANQAWE